MKTQTSNIIFGLAGTKLDGKEKEFFLIEFFKLHTCFKTIPSMTMKDIDFRVTSTVLVLKLMNRNNLYRESRYGLQSMK